MRELTIGFGPGGRIDVHDDDLTDNAAMVRIDGDLIAEVIEVREGRVLEVGAELRRLLDHAAEQGWVRIGQARHRKGGVTQWEQRVTEDRHQRQAAM